MVRSAWAAYLFNGESIDGWLPRGGQWSMVKHEDGNVISGQDGLFRRTFPWSGGPADLANYHVGASFRLGQAQAVEFHFGLYPSEDGEGPRFVLRVTADAAVLGERTGDRGPLAPRSEKLSLQLDPTREYGVEIERQHGYWFALLDTRKKLVPVGALPVRGDRELLEIRLLAEGDGGPALFSDIEIYQLKPRGTEREK
jgi:hypothetical protein